MEITSLNHHQINAAQLPLEKLAGNATLSEGQKVGEVSRLFEAVLLRQILAHAQKPLFGGSTASGGTAGSIYQDLVVNSLADQISQSGLVGLGRSLAPQLSRELKAAQEAEKLSTDKHGND
ncbi:MAG: hypothetical protein ACO1QS_18350 [Verrucomicrobiota bacterium]